MPRAPHADDLSDAHRPPLPPPVAVPLTVMPEHACPYFPDRVARYRAIRADAIDPAIYHGFMDANFRRSGTVLYQPVCRACSDCVQIRVPVALFAPRKSQRRCWRANADLAVNVGRPTLTDEKFDLYRRYVLQWHGRDGGAVSGVDPDGDDGEPTIADLSRFLYESPTDTLEFTYCDRAGRLVAVGICDVSVASLSSVYFFFDPDESRRGLGCFGALWEINWAARNGVPHYYLGYWIKRCRKMDYKLTYRPAELLGADGKWHEAPPDVTGV
jgi:arginyl-tRNA--protein-N-Asp/Glu arginylyltransferase